MRKLMVLAVAALFVNVLLPFYVDTYFYDEGNLIERIVWEEIKESAQLHDEELIPVVGLEVSVPDKRIHDIAPYDYYALIEMFWENRSSGEYYRYTIEVNGQWLDTIPSVERVIDGFGEYHDTAYFRSQLDTFFTITVDESGAEPIVVDGELDGDRKTYYELASRQIIQTDMTVNLSISGIPALGGDLPTDIVYNALLKTFPDPKEEQDKGLGEQVYEENENLKIGDEGSIIILDSENFWLSQIYNWSIGRAAIISGYEAVEINITSPLFGGFLPYEQEVWVSNNASFPIKDWVVMNSSFEGENETFWFVIENKKLMLDNQFQSGDMDIPWGGSISFRDKHPGADYLSWKPNYMPLTGDLEASSFHFSTEDAVAFAIENSVNSTNEDIANLSAWMEKYDPSGSGNNKVTISGADYYIEQDTSVGPQTHFWNITFGYAASWEEWAAAREEREETDKRNATWAYRICVAREVEWRPLQQQYEYGEPYVHYERLYNWSDGYYAPIELADQMVTLESSERVLRSFPGLEERLNINPTTDEIDWAEDDVYSYSLWAREEDDPWNTMVNTLTGLEIPNARQAWFFMHSNVYESGTSVSGTIDSETGRMVHYLVSEGTTLSLLF